ncbi:chitinase-3-like protein 1 [Mercenaria mercenaria]|uniref:chitinase-3-like protein 1 n=1 Tax=Mercenaria mercenaria TaxID=6596 RepID=UPI00234F141D|nr:chitinase-3-like protein 1 [Mercenaria mercenaria]
MALFKLTVVAVLFSAVTAKGYLRVCYYSNWAQYRPVPAKMTPDKIDPKLCTHLIYAFAELDSNSELSFTEWNDGDMVKVFSGLKAKNPDLKTLLAVGGYNQGSTPFSDMAASSYKRSKFARTAVDFLKTWGFDGLDLNWEFPGGKGGRKRKDKKNFISLIKELREVFDSSNYNKLLLTAALPAGKVQIDTGYDIAKMAKNLDFVSLMSYDFNGDWDDVAGHNSPLYPRDSETGDDRRKNVDWAATYFIEKGIPKEKLIIGLPTYGRHYKLSDKSNYNISAPIKRAGTKGRYTKEPGFLTFYEVCKLLGDGKRVFETTQKVPYLIHMDHWIGYDDEESFEFKLTYIKKKGFGGAAVWTIDMDDFGQLCPGSKERPAFPLISLMAGMLGENAQDDMPEEYGGDTDGNEDQRGINNPSSQRCEYAKNNNCSAERREMSNSKTPNVRTLLDKLKIRMSELDLPYDTDTDSSETDLWHFENSERDMLDLEQTDQYLENPDRDLSDRDSQELLDMDSSYYDPQDLDSRDLDSSEEDYIF